MAAKGPFLRSRVLIPLARARPGLDSGIVPCPFPQGSHSGGLGTSNNVSGAILSLQKCNLPEAQGR